MKKVKYDGYVVFHTDDDNRKTTFRYLDDAMRYCEREVGNSSYAKLFPDEDTYIYGPGDGSTTHMIRQRIVGFED